ncbi:MAG: hypothetical protein C4547_13925 [Phycisphaerales bacterium]|nr:MAG: hypothetical protein C4547_13925 [Phycisphaerales bacterium]
MSQTFRRVILTPPQASEEQLRALHDALRQAAARQVALAAQSPHVLRFTSEVQRMDEGFCVEHESAEPIRAATLFDADQAPSSAGELLRWAVALADALRAAHHGGDGRPAIHGGLSGGTLLVSPDGIEKVTDFGIAPAVCAAFGTDAYLNLAVASDRSDLGTGVWELLDPGEFEREDRICAFIDPEKYGTLQLDTFEPGSDIISAGFILHLLAERQHPYLVEPDAHRMVEMSEYMAMVRFNGARRKDLRESDDPGVQAWCQVVARMLSRLPQNRPAAGEVVERLRPFVKTIDAGELARRRLAAALEAASSAAPDEVDWNDCRQAASAVLAADVDEATVQAARGLLAKAEGQLRFRRGMEAVDRQDWSAAAEALGEDLDAAALDGRQARRLAQARSWIAAHTRITALQREMDAIAPDDPLVALAAMDSLKERTQSVTPGADWPAELSAALASLLASIEAAESRTRRQAEAARERIEADQQTAEAWLQSATDAADRQDFDGAEAILKAPPRLEHWPPTVRTAAAAVGEQVRQARDLQRRMEQAREWLARTRSAVEAENWDEAGRLASQPPDMTGLPDDLIQSGTGLCDQVRIAQQRRRDHAAARTWLADLSRQVDAKNWVAAAERLSRRPALGFWPDDVLSEEQRIKSEVERQIEIAEVEKQRVAREREQARQWLAGAKRAFDASTWDEALRILDDPPPDVQHWPDGVRQAAAAMAATCRQRQAQALADARAVRERQVRDAGAACVERWIHNLVGQFVDIGRCSVAVEAIDFDAEESPYAGRARARVKIEGIQPADFEVELAFREGGDGPAFDAPAPPEAASGIVAAIRARQSAQLEAVRSKLQSGLFPSATIDCTVNGLVSEVSADLSLSGPAGKTDTFACRLAWRSEPLAWEFVDLSPVIRRAVVLASRSAAETARAQLARGDELFIARYLKHLRIEPQPPEHADAGVLFGTLVLPLRVALSPAEGQDSVELATLSVKCPRLGKETLEGDPAELARRLAQAVVSAQERGREALIAGIRERAQKAAMKVKLSIHPGTINAPISDLKIEVAPRRRKAVTVTAHWSESAFRFQRSPGWDGALAPALAPGNAGSTFGNAGSTLPTLEERRPPARRWGAIAVGAVILLAVGAAGLQVLRSNGTQQRSPSTSVEADGSGAEAREDAEKPAPPPSDAPPPAPVVAEEFAELTELEAFVRARFEQTTFFEGVVLEDFVHADVDPDKTQGSLTAYVPGITVDTGTFPLVLPGEGQLWGLTDQDLRKIDEPLERLKHHRQEGPAASLTAAVRQTIAAGFAGRIDGALVRVRLGQVDWTMSVDGRRWDGEASASVEIGDAASFDLGAVQFRIVAGQISLSDEAGVGTQVHVGAEEELLKIQNAALQALTNDLRELGRSLSLRITDGAGQIGKFQNKVTLTATADGLADRVCSATWDSAALRFNADVAWTRVVANLQLAKAALGAINGQLREDHWLRQVSPDAAVVESKTPVEVETDAPSVMELVTSAPWVADSGNPIDLPQTDQLPLRLDLARIPPGAAPTRVDPKALERAFQPPPYWPAIEALGQLRQDPFLLTRQNSRQGLPPPAGLGEAITAAGGAETIAARVDVAVGEDRPQFDAASNGVSAWLDAGWARLPEATLEGLDAVALDPLLADWQEPVRYQLDAVPDERGDIRWTWNPDDAQALGESSAHVAALKKEILSHQSRLRVETDLEARLGGALSAALEPDEAWRLLRDIWEAKGVSLPDDADLLDWTKRRRGDLKKLPAHKAGVTPTIFVEYVSGSSSTYAISWTLTIPPTAEPTIGEGPTLRKLGSTADLEQLSGDAAGDTLVADVLDDVPDAAAAQNPYDRHLGIVIGADGRIASIGGATLDQWTFAERRARPFQIRQLESRDPALSWSSLADLVRDDLSNRRCDYWLLASLAEDGKLETPDAAQQWATATLRQVTTAP